MDSIFFFFVGTVFTLLSILTFRSKTYDPKSYDFDQGLKYIIIGIFGYFAFALTLIYNHA